jgi:hypothetical protein
MRPSKSGRSGSNFLWDLLTFERLLTGPVLHLVYWAGLGLILIMSFGGISAAVTMAVRDGPKGILLGFSALIAGLLVVAALVLLWRMICEFYVAVFRISDDLRALRLQGENRKPGDEPPTLI